jgi:hypothetical protein
MHTSESAHTLNLMGCGGIRDVGALGGVHTLNLSQCPHITDVSALRGVHTLNLSHCYGIRDVSALAGVHADSYGLCVYHGCECPRRRALTDAPRLYID